MLDPYHTRQVGHDSVGPATVASGKVFSDDVRVMSAKRSPEGF